MAARKKTSIKRDPKKECKFKELISSLADLGFQVRREKLKQGFGWKVMSGECVLEEKNVIFVDSRLTQDEQIEFLAVKLRNLTQNQLNEPSAFT